MKWVLYSGRRLKLKEILLDSLGSQCVNCRCQRVERDQWFQNHWILPRGLLNAVPLYKVTYLAVRILNLLEDLGVIERVFAKDVDHIAAFQALGSPDAKVPEVHWGMVRELGYGAPNIGISDATR